MRFIHAILPAGLMAFTITAQAVPNMWSSGFGMGVTEYIITSPEKVMLI
jgi:cellulose synthase/poly-beta-1,6-N-acetylglucosamine synthase-like glycosyltransferase